MFVLLLFDFVFWCLLVALGWFVALFSLVFVSLLCDVFIAVQFVLLFLLM